MSKKTIETKPPGPATAKLTTEVKLICAAEQLFATHGLDGVSLRQINKAAGQRNTSGLHYHFGSKDALVVAVFRHRVPEIDRRRAAMIADIKSKGLEDDLPVVVRAMFMPLVEELDGGTNEKAYVRFLAQFYSHPTVRKAEQTSDDYEEAYRMAQRVLEREIPPPIVKQRLAMVTGHVIHSLSDLEARIVTGSPRPSRLKLQLFVQNLLDTVVGALRAPVSEATREGLRGKASKRAN
jgi:AcrR family transcriptional regulator